MDVGELDNLVGKVCRNVHYLHEHYLHTHYLHVRMYWYCRCTLALCVLLMEWPFTV